MNFEEKSIISIPNIDLPIIYFLLKENTVVYVGQSLRPINWKNQLNNLVN